MSNQQPIVNSYSYRILQLILLTLTATYSCYLIPSFWIKHVAEFTNYNLLTERFVDIPVVYTLNIVINLMFVVYGLLTVLYNRCLFNYAVVLTIILIVSFNYTTTWLLCLIVAIMTWNQFTLLNSESTSEDNQQIVPQIVVEKNDTSTQTDFSYVNSTANYEQNLANYVNQNKWFDKQSTVYVINKPMASKIENINLYEELYKI